MNILVVDDVEIQRETIRDDLVDAGYEVVALAEAETALKMVRDNSIDLVITDLKMPGMDGLELLKAVKQLDSEVEVVVMTAYATVKTAVEAIQRGAHDYLTKPFEVEELLQLVARISKMKQLTVENQLLREQLGKRYQYGNLIGKSYAVKQVYEQIKSVAPTDTSVLITGSTGTGKEVVAETIHHNSQRALGPLVKVSCAILSREILESELFGHEKGAFTGASREKKGRFEIAKGGTIYLDDVDDIPLDLQVKLLRVLESRELERVGGTRTVQLNVRVIASTKYDLYQLVKEKKFREDLYYRLNVFPIKIPPLVSRKEDIPLLFEHFFKEFSPKRHLKIDPRTVAILMDYPWEGNVRELKNLVERLSVSCNCDLIKPECLPIEILKSRLDLGAQSGIIAEKLSLPESLERFEISLLKEALTTSKGNRQQAARLLNIPVTTLKSKMKKYKLGNYSAYPSADGKAKA